MLLDMQTSPPYFDGKSKQDRFPHCVVSERSFVIHHILLCVCLYFIDNWLPLIYLSQCSAISKQLSLPKTTLLVVTDVLSREILAPAFFKSHYEYSHWTTADSHEQQRQTRWDKASCLPYALVCKLCLLKPTPPATEQVCPSHKQLLVTKTHGFVKKIFG